MFEQLKKEVIQRELEQVESPGVYAPLAFTLADVEAMERGWNAAPKGDEITVAVQFVSNLIESKIAAVIGGQ